MSGAGVGIVRIPQSRATFFSALNGLASGTGRYRSSPRGMAISAARSPSLLGRIVAGRFGAEHERQTVPGAGSIRQDYTVSRGL